VLDNNIKDLVNAGIGLFKTGEENLQGLFTQAEKIFREMRDRGAEDGTDAAQQLRDILDNALSNLQNIADWNNFSFLAEELQKKAAPILRQLTSFLGEERIADLNSRFDELKSYIMTGGESGVSGGDDFGSRNHTNHTNEAGEERNSGG